MRDSDRQFIARAARYLESPALVNRLSHLVGRPVEKGLELLPERARGKLHRATHQALEAALRAGIASLPEPTKTEEFGQAVVAAAHSRRKHAAGAAVTGLLGGLFGLPSFLVELPITTTLMLRSISQVAASFGEDPSKAETQLECLYVFTLGGPSPEDDEAESAYYAGRVVFAQMVSQALNFVAGRSARELTRALQGKGAPVLVELIVRVAARFDVSVGRKALGQLIPGIGAGVGALLNVAFMEHFNQTATYHFGLRRLEREYGAEAVRAAYAQALKSSS